MEIKTTTVKSDVQFKASNRKAIGIDIEKLPTFPEALKAKKEADIALVTDSPYYDRTVQFVINHIRQRYEEYAVDAIFNYGYILGIRAERARRKGVK